MSDDENNGNEDARGRVPNVDNAQRRKLDRHLNKRLQCDICGEYYSRRRYYEHKSAHNRYQDGQGQYQPEMSNEYERCDDDDDDIESGEDDVRFEENDSDSLTDDSSDEWITDDEDADVHEVSEFV